MGTEIQLGEVMTILEMDGSDGWAALSRPDATELHPPGKEHLNGLVFYHGKAELLVDSERV